MTSKLQQHAIKQKLDKETHEYNINGIQAVASALFLEWKRAGCPMTKEEFTPEFKHSYIYLSGLIQRLYDVLVLKKV